MEKKTLEIQIIKIFNSGIENVRAFRRRIIPVLRKTHGESGALQLWDLAWSDDSNVKKFLNRISDSELEALAGMLD